MFYQGAYYLNCFILIGYTEHGDPVQITTAKSPKDYDALSTALQKYVFDTMPKICYDLEWTCSKCGKTESHTIEGVQSFLS